MNPNEVYDGISFEDYVQQIFLSEDLQTITTPASNDYGADLIVKNGDITFAFQCKYYSRPVGIKAVQEVMSSLNYYDADYGAVITNSTFTQQAQNLANTNNILLIDGSHFYESFKGILDSFASSIKGAKKPVLKPKAELTMDDLVIRYGVSKSTVLRNYLSAGLPYMKVGREYRFDEKEVEEWEIEKGSRMGRYGMYLPAYKALMEQKIQEYEKAKKTGDQETAIRLKNELTASGFIRETHTAWVWILMAVAIIVFIVVSVYIFNS